MNRFIFRIGVLAILVAASVLLGYSLAKVGPASTSRLFQKNQEPLNQTKKPILRLAIIADSHGDNEQLAEALAQAQGAGINLVIGLGDWTTVGTVDELRGAREVFEKSKLSYFVTAGDHDLWDSRNRGQEELSNFSQVFGEPSLEIERDGVHFVIVDNSDIYKGILPETWQLLSDSLKKPAKLRFVLAHKTPFHPESKHIMGEDSQEVARQAQSLLSLIENDQVDGFFSGDLHFFAQYQSPDSAVKITTVGAVTRERNFQGPRFAIVSIYSDYSWEVEDVEIR